MSEPRIIDIYAAALSVDARPGTVRLWVNRNELTHHGYDRKRRVLVDLDELDELAARKKANATSTTARQAA